MTKAMRGRSINIRAPDLPVDPRGARCAFAVGGMIGPIA
jgi:hypothetical protein